MKKFALPLFALLATSIILSNVGAHDQCGKHAYWSHEDRECRCDHGFYWSKKHHECR